MPIIGIPNLILQDLKIISSICHRVRTVLFNHYTSKNQLFLIVKQIASISLNATMMQVLFPW
jgi:hypothetical protein